MSTARKSKKKRAEQMAWLKEELRHLMMDACFNKKMWPVDVTAVLRDEAKLAEEMQSRLPIWMVWPDGSPPEQSDGQA